MKIKLKLGHKLGAGFLAALICSLSVNLYNTTNFKFMKEVQSQILDDYTVSVNTLLNVKSDLIMSRRDLLECVVDQQIEKKAYDTQVIESSVQNIIDTLAVYEASITYEKEREQYEQIKIALDSYVISINEIIRELNSNQVIEGEELASLEEQCNELLKHIEQSVAGTTEALDRAGTRSRDAIQKAMRVNLLGSILSAILSIVVAAWITINILKNTRRILAVLNKAAEGDLTEEIVVNSHDEMAEIAEASNQMIAALANVTKEIMQVAGEVAASSEELLSSAEETNASVDQVTLSITNLADGTSEQVKAIQETDANIIGVARRIDEVADNAMNVNSSAKKMVELANNGLMQSKTASNAIVQIKETTDQTAEVVGRLGGKSDKIGEFVEVIKGLASQTNLLALNAAIEAARAGEQGKGFAVVADEVKVLAEQSASSAEEIAKLVDEIQKEMATVVEAMATSAKEVSVGVEVVETASKSFVSIADEIEEVVKQIAEVNEVTGHLKQNADVVVENMKTISTVAEETSASTEEISASAEEQKHSTGAIVEASEELTQLATSLQTMVNRFQVK